MFSNSELHMGLCKVLGPLDIKWTINGSLILNTYISIKAWNITGRIHITNLQNDHGICLREGTWLAGNREGKTHNISYKPFGNLNFEWFACISSSKILLKWKIINLSNCLIYCVWSKECDWGGFFTSHAMYFCIVRMFSNKRVHALCLPFKN